MTDLLDQLDRLGFELKHFDPKDQSYSLAQITQSKEALKK